MSFIARRAAPRALRTPHTTTPARAQFRRTYAAAEDENKDVLRKAAKKDPELYALYAIMIGAFGLAGWHFSRNPTSSSSVSRVAYAPGSEPWNTGENAKYQYHPGGDKTKRKNAPSALNEVVIPNVNLPKSLHEKYNKWGKEEF